MRALWVKRDVEDNYVHPWFLSQLRYNQTRAKYSYLTLLSDSSVFVLNVCLAVGFVLSFVAIYAQHRDPRQFSIAAALMNAPMVYMLLQKRTYAEAVSTVKSLLVTVLTTLILTPVFKSLTESTSSDSIWTLCGWLVIANIMFASRPMTALSTNTSMAATIVLSSRLQKSVDVFYFILYNMQTYVSLPIFYIWLRRSMGQRRRYNFAILVIVMLACLYLVHTILGPVFLALWVLVVTLMLFGIPALFLVLQRYKTRIAGPWDAAVPILD